MLPTCTRFLFVFEKIVSASTYPLLIPCNIDVDWRCIIITINNYLNNKN